MALSDTRFEQMYPVLDAAQVDTARRFASGEARRIAPGEQLYDVGTRNVPAFLIIEGSLEIARRDGLHREASVVSMTAGQFSGEVSQLSGLGTLASARGGPDGCTVLPFDAAHVRALLIGAAELGELMMRSFILRRVGLIQGGGAGCVLIDRGDTARRLRLQGFLARNGYPCTVLDAAADDDARALIERLAALADERERRRMGRAARASVERHFSERAMVDGYEIMLQELETERNRRGNLQRTAGAH